MNSANAALDIKGSGGDATPTSERPPAILRGSARGLEIVIDGRATVDAVIATATAKLSEAPTFFKGSDVRIRVEDGPLPVGTLGKLDELAAAFDLRIVEVGAAKRDKKADKALVDSGRIDAIPRPNLAAGSAPTPPAPAYAPPAPNSVILATAAVLAPALSDPRLSDALAAARGLPTDAVTPPAPALVEPTDVASATAAALAPALGTPALEAALASAVAELSPPAGEPVQPSLPLVPVTSVRAPVIEAPTEPAIVPSSPDQLELALRSGQPKLPQIEILPDTRLFVGPVRSGVILDHRGHLIVFGDVNPGAEVRAAGNIVVLGRLRGTAHAGIGAAAGFIVALRLEPQQLRIGRLVARASDGETASLPEIAYVTGTQIVVERYLGRLPNGLASTLS